MENNIQKVILAPSGDTRHPPTADRLSAVLTQLGMLKRGYFLLGPDDQMLWGLATISPETRTPVIVDIKETRPELFASDLTAIARDYFAPIKSVDKVFEAFKLGGANNEIWVFIKYWDPDDEDAILRAFRVLRGELRYQYDFIYHPNEDADPYSLIGPAWRELYVAGNQ